MKKRHVAVNILTAIPAVLFSILLIVCLLATSLYAVVIKTVSPSTIVNLTQTAVTEFVQSPDFEEMILENEVVQESITELGISSETVGEIMQSEAANEIIDLLATDASNLLSGVEAESALTPDALMSIVKEHAGELSEIAGEAMEEPLTEEEMKELEDTIVQTIEDSAEEFTAAMPDMEELRTTIIPDPTVQQYLQYFNRNILFALCGICLFMALIIFALRCYRFGGLLWIGVDCTLTGLIIALLLTGTRNILLPMLPQDLGHFQNLVNYIIDRVLNTISVWMWICLGLAVVFIGGFILLYQLVVKKRIAAAAATTNPTAMPTQTVAPQEIPAEDSSDLPV